MNSNHVELKDARVLVVDDDPSSARAVTQHLESLGMVVEIAHSWGAALKKYQSLQPDLVLMDAVMPDMDGFKLTSHLRARYRERYVPIVFLTGLDDLSARERGVMAGADDFLSKPVDPVMLRVRVRAMMRIRRLTAALEEKGRELEDLATRDQLSGVLNRRRFDESLVSEFNRSRRYDHPLSLLVCDIDHFKQINDELGHATGDEVIAFLGSLLTELKRGSDLAFRYGGEEFVLLLPETNPRNAAALAERLRREFCRRSNHTSAGERTISIGVSGIEDLGHKAPAELLFRSADIALYRAKSTGRDRVCVFGDESQDKATLLEQCKEERAQGLKPDDLLATSHPAVELANPQDAVEQTLELDLDQDKAS